MDLIASIFALRFLSVKPQAYLHPGIINNPLPAAPYIQMSLFVESLCLHICLGLLSYMFVALNTLCVELLL